jgi:uncharacterized repeat protein (TIGR01451 family)
MSTNKTGYGFPVWATAALLGAAFALVAVVVASFAGGTARAQDVGTNHLASDLHIRKSVKPKTVRVGAKQTFVIKVVNERGATARGVRMRDPLPDKVRFVRASTSRHVPGSCRSRNRTVTCDLGNLRVGRSVTVKIFVKPVRSGRYVNRAFVEQKRTAELQARDNIDAVQTRTARS